VVARRCFTANSNYIHTGMSLRRYEIMLDTWRREGNYPAT
jgi:hypothetical protein